MLYSWRSLALNTIDTPARVPAVQGKPNGGARNRPSFGGALAWLFAAVCSLTFSGCRTTSDLTRTYRLNPSAASSELEPPEKPVNNVRLQSPADVAESFGAAGQPLNATRLPRINFAPDETSTSPSLPTSPSVSAAGAGDPGALSSIARNRYENRGVPRPPGATANGRGGSNLSPRLRDRYADSVGPGDSPQFNYPDIHADPAKIYHDRFGIDEDHDRFLFPWIMNLIFEDRWLLAEPDPTTAVQNQFRHRMKVDIRDPDPDTANFPNGAYTLAKGRLYIENSPLGLYGASKNTPRLYQWEYLLRYGLTDNLEFRIFSNGLTAQAAMAKMKATSGVSPLAFDFKANFWEENTKYHIPAMGLEVYLQTTFGSPAFNSGTQPSINVLFDQTLPFEIGFEYNLGIAGTQNGLGETKYQFNFAWSFQREIVKDFDIFIQGFYNQSGLPRLRQFEHVRNYASLVSEATIPIANVVGVGAIKTVNDRFAIFGSYNFGTTGGSPRTIALTGFALAF